jgi:general secretion pathway protein F
VAVFQYKGLDKRGRSVKGLIEADTVRGARARLRERDIFPSSIEESREQQGKKGRLALFDPANRRVGASQLALATRQLATLISAGMPLVDALRALSEQIDHPRLKRVVSEVGDRVNEGTTMAEAMREFPKVFPRLYVNMISSGEVSGSLDVVLERLAELLEAQVALQRKLLSALTYPVLMIVLCVVVVIILLTYVVPQITEMFAEKKTALPLPTVIVVGLSDFLRNYWIPLLATGAFTVIALSRYAKTAKGRYRVDHLMLRLPVFGTMQLKIATSRFARNLGTLLTSGVELLTALGIVKNIIGNSVLEEVVERATDGVREGKGLAAQLNVADRFPRMLIHMIAIGEQTGQLESMLLRAANSYEMEVSALVSGLASILEPILILFLAVIVGTILASVMLPMLEMSSLAM